jgi:hypothetical protein
LFFNIHNVSTIVAEPGNNAVYYCYLFGKSVETYTEKRLSTFVDFTDVYSSFLMNLLSESLAIRTYSIKMQTYETNKEWANFIETLAKLMKAILNFESATAKSKT